MGVCGLFLSDLNFGILTCKDGVDVVNANRSDIVNTDIEIESFVIIGSLIVVAFGILDLNRVDNQVRSIGWDGVLFLEFEVSH